MTRLLAGAALALASTLPAVHAADVPQGLIDSNANVCVQMSKIPGAAQRDPNRPTDPAKVPSYCACSSKAYWSSVPQADYDGMLAESRAGGQGPHGKAITDALHDRMEAAGKSCR